MRRALSSDQAEKILADIAFAKHRSLDWICFGLRDGFMQMRQWRRMWDRFGQFWPLKLSEQGGFMDPLFELGVELDAASVD